MEWVVTAEDEGERLDRFLVERTQGWSRSKLQAFIKEGLVQVDGQVQGKTGIPLITGQRVSVGLPEHAPKASPLQVKGQLHVLHEDEHVLIVNKPAGLLSHRREGGTEISLAELAEAHCGPLPSPQGESRPGIVHRLDRETSGVMVLGKTEAAQTELMRQFQERTVSKTYAVLVSGALRFDSDWIEEPLGRDPRRPDRIRVLEEEEGGRPASTFYEVVERYGDFSLLHCQPKTGRTHQIRVHLNVAKLDVIADKVYRVRTRRNPTLPEDAPKVTRQMLHALRLELTHPATSEALVFEAPLPADFETLRAWLAERQSTPT